MLAGLGVGVGSALMKRRDQLMRLVRGGRSESGAVDGAYAGYDTGAPAGEAVSRSPTQVTAAAADAGDEVDAGAATVPAGESGERESAEEGVVPPADEPAADEPDSANAEASGAEGTRGRANDG